MAAAADAFADTHYATLDPAAEAAALATIVAYVAEGSKKRRREALKGSQPCHEFARTGACKFGDACRFGHEVVKEGPDAREHMRGLAIAREARFVGGAGEGAGMGGGAGAGAGADGGAGAGASADAAATDAAAGSGAGAAPVADAALSGLAHMVGRAVTPLSMIERFYTRLFAPGADAARRGADQYVHLQANRVALVGLAPAHPLLRLRLAVTSVVFDARLTAAETPTGKHKHGALWVEADTVIATATTADGRTWPLRAGVRAMVLEVNARLEAEPALLTRKAPTVGHLAVLNVHLKRVLEVTSGLLTEAAYGDLCAARGLPGPRDT
jgi:hypothetical protein